LRLAGKVAPGEPMTRVPGIRAASGAENLTAALSTLVLAVMVIPALALAAAPSGGGAAKANAHLESMQIEIWPDYDRPAALVILRGEFASDVGLPAAVSLRIPASSGGPAAVAYAAEKKGQLLNLMHDRSDASEFITLRFTVPSRFFHVEFYDRFATGASERTYNYLWPGDLSVSWLDVVVQEPAGASNLSVQPALGDTFAGSDGMRYRAAQLGPHKQGIPLPIEIRYTKADPRTSAEILKLNASAPLPQANISSGPGDASRVFLALGAAALLIAASAAGLLFWWRRRARIGITDGARWCTKCGNRAASGDHFCSKCGAALA
jgi:hypothetical protein